MAYGNWGAFVYKNGERMKSHEDQTPYRECELEAGYAQAFHRSDGMNPHHAVLGEGEVRLCGYKDWPVLFVRGEKVKIEWEGGGEDSASGDVEGYSWSASAFDNGVELELRCPSGDVWRAKCGYEMGAGHDD